MKEIEKTLHGLKLPGWPTAGHPLTKHIGQIN